MADPLLTSLCVICHVSAPKYTCPRCAIRTCSLACIKKHKAWSSCSGTRDATAYVGRTRLRTAAGVDHDYNFLHGIERSMERAERVVVRDRGLVAEEELHPLTVQEVKWRVGRDGRRRKVLVTRALREAKGRVFEKFLAQRLRKLNVTILCAPAGMARMRENRTTLNRRSGRINWQVEWLEFSGETGEHGPETKRVLGKAMDDLLLHQAYRNAVDEQIRAENRPLRKLPRGSWDEDIQAPFDAKWNHATDSVQDPYTGTWGSLQGQAMAMWPSERDTAQQNEYQFFLARPHTRSDQPSLVTRLDPKDSLRTVLTNVRVLEFPTIYVLRAGETLPAGFVLGPKDTTQAQQQGMKRKGGQQDKKPARAAKKRRQIKLEEGEVASGDEEGGSEDDNDGPKGSVGLEAGEVLAEQSFDEDEDGDDDSTSSSGTDSD